MKSAIVPSLYSIEQVTPEAPFVHFINIYQSPDPQRGIGMMPKRGCDVNTCEIAKFYRLNNNGLCQVVSMTVPRRSELFQEDLYPDTLGDEAAQTAEEWLEGAEAEPILISLKVSPLDNPHFIYKANEGASNEPSEYKCVLFGIFK